jgi:primosomal protein N' (replication factor Y)
MLYRALGCVLKHCFHWKFVSKQPVLKVAINVPLSRLFDYLPPADAQCPPPGARVRVPFGRQRQVGLVVAHARDSELPPNRIRRALGVLDDAPLLREEDLRLIGFTSDYYHHPIGEVAAAAIPALLRQGRPLNPLLRQIAATDAARHFDIEALSKKAPRQAELLELLLDAGGNGIDVETLAEQLPAWRRSYRALAAKALVTEFDMRADDPEPATRGEATVGPELNGDQQTAVDEIRSARGFHASILDGVTGSGKTEVYLHLIGDTIASGRQVLVLVPEIGLTPQLVTRLRTRLGIEPALLHSSLSDLERLRSWRQARNGDAKLVVGTRSAVFTPLQDAGLIIVDEEHDHSFKQQEGLRYSARDLAIARAKQLDVPIVLGSATPTLEMLHHCETGLYSHLSLPQRAGSAKPPQLRIVDLGRAVSTEGLSEPLAVAIEQHLEESGQVLIFLNRRGFAPTLICSGCGHVAECPRCDSRMTVHARDRCLRCHHCGSSRPLDEHCGECGAQMRPLGEGTQRLEDALVRRYPARRVMRIDSDSTQRKGAMDEALQRATCGDAEILVGTQMLSKGHHFPKLTLVGIVNADQGLFGTDFRSDERLAQSIIQVAGRAGRESRVGEVIIQTAFPAHPFWQRLIEAGYAGVAHDAMQERRAANWPPFSRLALLRSAATRRSDAHAFLDVAAGFVAGLARGRLRVLGPVDAPMARRAGRYRVQLLLQSSDRRALHEVLRELRPRLEADPVARKVRWSIDVDPVELF